MEYVMTPGEIKVQTPEMVLRNVCITQENAPSFVLPDDKWSKPFRYKFSCVCNDEYVEFEFEQPDRIEYGQYDWPNAVEKWLLPHLAKRPNVLADRPAAPLAAGPATEGSEVERRVGGAVSPAPSFGGNTK